MNKKRTILVIGTLLVTTSLFQAYHTLVPSSENHAVQSMGVADVQTKDVAVKYTCPMHPQIVSDKLGQCPICGMDLVAIEHNHSQQSQQEEASSNVVQDNSGRKVLYWHDPMVLGKKFDKPGKSPFMDMELVPKYADESGMEENGGKPVISINPDNVQKMGVRTEKVIKRMLGGDFRATGIIMENERIRWDMFSQVEGRVDNLKYSAVGDRVKKGDLFYTLYSPELLVLQNDYHVALKAGYKDLAAIARKRMKLLGVDDKTLSTIAKNGKAFDSVPFYIPADGILNQLKIHKGSYLKINAKISTVQDLSSVWVEAAIPEKDLSQIKAGDAAKVSITSSTHEMEATVDYIYPTITPETRTGKARLVVDNPNYLLKPSGYATVVFSGDTSERLTVSNSAVLRDTSGSHVIIALGNGKFQARTVQTGATAEGYTEITEGLSEGEEVVVNGQFLIDSESNLRESLDKISGGSDAQ